MSFSVIFSLTLTFLCLAQGHEHFQVVPDPSVTAFRRIGALVDGVAHAHIAISFDLAAEAKAVQELGENLNKISRNTSLAMWAPVIHEIRPMEKDWANFRKELKDNFSPHRERRQAILGLALGVVVVASAGAGAFALEETHELKARMDGTDGRIAHMLAAAQSNARVEHVLRDNVSVLKHAVQNITNSIGDLDNAVVVSESVHALLYRLRQRLHGLKQIWTHRLDVDLLDSKELTDVYDLVVKRAAKLNYRLINEGVHQLHLVELSFTLEGDKLTLFLHLPVTSSRYDDSLTLYQHVALPVKFNSTFGLITAPNTILAVDDKKETFVELSTDDLQGCIRHEMDFQCSSVFPRTRGGRTSCLTALFLHHSSAQRWCSVEPVLQRTALFRLNATAFLIIAEDKITLNFECEREEMESQDVTGLALVRLASHCSVIADDFVFRAAQGDLPGDIHLVVAAPSVDLMERLRETPKFLSDAPDLDLSEEEQKIDDQLAAASNVTVSSGNTLWAISATVCVVVVGVLLFICWVATVQAGRRSVVSAHDQVQSHVNNIIARAFVADNVAAAPVVPPSTPEAIVRHQGVV